MQEIFTRYANGEPAEKIAASLNERGLRTRTGKPFVKNSLFQIFRNRRYIGEYRYKDIVTPGGIPAIVDEDLFNRVQQRFEQNKIAHGRPAKGDVSYLLTTKLFCGCLLYTSMVRTIFLRPASSVLSFRVRISSMTAA